MISVVFALHDACISERSTNTYAGAYTTRKQIVIIL